MLKTEIRKRMKNIRNNLSKEQIKTKSNYIINALKNKLPNNYETYFIYHDFNNEVCTKHLINYLLENNKKVFLPKIIKDEMCAVPFNKQSTLSLNKFKIYEPNGAPQEIDTFVCIMPLLAVDKKGNRIGFGKGYYDKFLKNKNCLKIGLCYDFQILDNIATENHDIPIDIIISESRIIYTQQKKNL